MQSHGSQTFVIVLALLGTCLLALFLPFVLGGERLETRPDIVLTPRFTPTPTPLDRALTREAFAMRFFTPTNTSLFASAATPFPSSTSSWPVTLPVIGSSTATPTVVGTRHSIPGVNVTVLPNGPSTLAGSNPQIPTSTPMRTATAFRTPSRTPSRTPTPFPTSTPTVLPTSTLVPTATPVPSSTNTPLPTIPPPSSTPEPSETPIPTNTHKPPTDTPVPPIDTPVPPPTDTPEPPPIDTPEPPPTELPPPIDTPMATQLSP